MKVIKYLHLQLKPSIEATPKAGTWINELKSGHRRVMKNKSTPNEESKEKIEALNQQIKQGVADVLSSAAIKDKYERLQAELAELNGGSDGSLIKEPTYA
nr:acetyl-coenzyme A carboxylase carboxyl transferase subunit alpha, chloroplastic [Tanacetum cinerariifolium]